MDSSVVATKRQQLPSTGQGRVPRQGWAEVAPPDPEIALTPARSTLMSPSSGEGSSSPLEISDNFGPNESPSLDEFSQVKGGLRPNSAEGQAGHVSQQARQRIREKTKSMVEKQRRLAKRMARNQRNESIEGEQSAETGGAQQKEEIERDDVPIEQSIQLGAKYVEGQLRWDGEPDLEGQEEAAQMKGQQQPPFPLLMMAPAKPYTREDAAKFKQMLTWKWPNQPRGQGDLESGQKMETVEKEKDEDLAMQNMERPFQEGQFFALPPPSQFVWRPALPWADWLRQSNSRRWASQRPTGLWLDLQGLEFDHHWLFTRTEAVQRELLAAYDSWAEVHQQMLRAVKGWLALRQQEEGEEGGEEGHSTGMEALFRQVLERQSQLERCRAALERAWAGTDQTRGRFLLERLEGHAEVFEEESEGGVPEQLRAFFHSPLYVLSEREEGRAEAEAQQPAVPEMERQRRQAVASCRYQAQVYFNELLVCSSDECPLQWPSFSLSFGQIFPLRVFERPEQLRLALRERFGRGHWQPIADIFVPLPNEEEGEGVVEEQAEKKWTAQTGLQFASMVQRGSYKGTLGCGQGGHPFMQGRLFCSLRWQKEGGAEANRMDSKLEGRRAKAREERHPSTPSLFPVGSLLCSAEALQADPRLLVLERRWEGRKAANGRKQKRIGLELADEFGAMDLEGRGQEEKPHFGKHRRDEMDLERRRRLGPEFARELRRHLRESGEQQKRARNLANLVREEPLPELSVGLLSSLFANRQLDLSRRLKPHRHTTVPTGRPLMDSALRPRLVLNIQHATGVPQRANGEAAQLFLLCSLQGQSLTTGLVDGRHANWQETLVLDVPLEGREEQLFLEVEMFDREVRPMDQDDREKDTRHERVEKRWLGSARIPLDALQSMAKLDGHLALQGPTFYTGYNISSDRPTTVRLLASLDPPPMQMPQALPSSAPFGESDQNLISECLKFESRLRQRFPARRVLALAMDSSGKRVLASRFLRRLAPPPQVASLFGSEPRKAVELAAQIVALIPTFLDSDEGHPPIWSTADEIVRIGTASPDEQAILLCCWLLGLQLSAVLLLGTALPDGPNCAFVLVQFGDGQHWLISPGGALHFAPSDPNCPLLSVGTVLAMDNVFANLQRAEHPSQLDFDLRKRAHWEALFPEGRADLVSIQPEMLRYEPVDEDALMELRTGLEREIRLQFDEARPFAIPQWNLMASRSLRELLADCWRDFSSSTSSQSPLADVHSRLAHFRPAFQLSALGFRLPFISRPQIIRHCLRTLIHTNSEPQAQFALAVHLQPFFGTFLSCSVAICTLLPEGSSSIGRNV